MLMPLVLLIQKYLITRKPFAITWHNRSLHEKMVDMQYNK